MRKRRPLSSPMSGRVPSDGAEDDADKFDDVQTVGLDMQSFSREDGVSIRKKALPRSYLAFDIVKAETETRSMVSKAKPCVWPTRFCAESKRFPGTELQSARWQDRKDFLKGSEKDSSDDTPACSSISVLSWHRCIPVGCQS